MKSTKLFALAAVCTALVTAPAHAGGMAEPLMEPEVIAEETSNSGGFVIPLLLLAAIVAVASSSGGGGGSPPVGPS